MIDSDKLSVISVLIKPGAITLHLIFLDPNSSAIDFEEKQLPNNSVLISEIVKGANPPTNALFVYKYLMDRELMREYLNSNAVKFDFVSSIDTINTNTKITKTVLLHTSPYSRLVNTPYEISLQKALEQPAQNDFNIQQAAIAVLLEGTFESLFKNRINKLSNELPFIKSSKPNRMLVISDGDIAQNHISRGAALPLGYDNYEKRQYGNKDFILNAIDYLLEEDALIAVRTRELKIRLLDTQKINLERSFWQIINLIIPIALVIIFGIFKQYARKKKYSNEK